MAIIRPTRRSKPPHRIFLKALKKTTFTASAAQAFRTQLLAWYDAHARALPWREDHDPYRVWLSEIMLQQTRVAAVIEHYREFLRRFPTIEDLAAAKETSVVAAWSGLGYYRRARMLHAAAKIVVRERGGRFPSTSAELRTLPGIGRYTAAAIASIAFDEPVAVVDGNVERLLQRFSGKGLSGELLWQSSAELLAAQRPGDFNQAMMELGATVCAPRAPACLTCPVIELCATRGELKSAAKTARQKKRELHYALHCRNGSVLLIQRPSDSSLMPGMWELPQLDGFRTGPEKSDVPSIRSSRGRRRRKENGSAPLLTLRHSITVTDYRVHVWPLKMAKIASGKWVRLRDVERLPLTGLARKILRQAKPTAGRTAPHNEESTGYGRSRPQLF